MIAIYTFCGMTRRSGIWTGLGLAVVGVAITSGVIAGFRPFVSVAGLAVLYLVPVTIVAIRFGWWPALVAAILAFLSYDFLFTEPLYTFTIHDPSEWISLIAFLFVAAVTSNLAARERRRRDEADRSAEQAFLLYQLSHALGTEPPAEAWPYVAEQVRLGFGAQGCSIQFGAEGRPRTLASAGASIPDQASVQMLGQRTRAGTGRRIVIHQPARSPGLSVISVPLRTGQYPIGTLRLAGRGELSKNEAQFVATIAEQLAAAIERERLLSEAHEAEILRRTDEIRQQLLASVSHDLRTPLASISASAESLLEENLQWSNEDRRTFLTTIHGEADRLNRLVTNLLDVSRIESGALKPRNEWYDLGELAREVVDRFRGRYPDRPVAVDAPEQLPPLELDYVMIDEVLTNLMENAVKYTPSGSSLELRIRAVDGRPAHVRRRPRTGYPGERATPRLRQVLPSGSAGCGSGSGLGLAVVKGFVEAHQGRMWIEETPGGGATFCMELPAHDPEAPRQLVESAEMRA